MGVDKENVLYSINVELQRLGIQYVGDDPDRAATVLKRVKEIRANKPPCWARAFEHDDIRCRQCEEFRSCHLATTYPKFTLDIPSGGLVSCNMCDGDFIVEIYGSDGVIVDFACSTDGCRNTWRSQMARTE